MKDPNDASARSEASNAEPRLDAQAELEAERERRVALEIENQRLMHMIATAPGAFVVFEQLRDQRACPFASPGIEEVFGLTPDEIAADPSCIWRRIHPADHERIQRTLAEATRNFRAWDCEYRVCHPSKGDVWVDAHAMPTTEPDGKVTYYAFIRDVTDRKRMERRIRLRSHALENSLNAFGIVSEEGKILYVNAAYLKMWGFTDLPEVVGTSPASHCVDPGVPLEIINTVERDGSCAVEFTARRKDGSTFETLMSVQKATDEQGRPIYLATAIDITERKRVEQELRESRAQLVAALDAASTGTWQLDLREKTVTVDDATLNVCGRTREQIGKGELDHLFSFVHSEDQPRIRQELAAFMAEGGERILEFRVVRNDGMVRWLGVTGRAESDASGVPVRLRGAVVDITERKRAQESQRLEALGTLAGGIAHDFNNILLAISANTNLAIADLPPDHAVQEYLGEIDRAGIRASQLVQRIVAFSRPEPQHLESLQLPPVVEEALRLLRATVPAMVELRTDFAEQLPAVRADSTQVHQLIINLVTNAAHAIGPSAGVISIKLEARRVTGEPAVTVPNLRAGRYVRLSVSDTGRGMDRATLERIFEPFFTTKPPGQGAGLGLAVVHGIMKSYDGAVAVQSEPGNGSVFELYFPAAKRTGDTPRPKASEIPAGRGQRVLYVDDERPIVKAATRTLRRLGYVVTGFTEPTEALRAFRARPHDFDVVVTDLWMPTMSGFDFARDVLTVRTDVPVLMMSGYIRPEDRETARAIGVRDLIGKPDAAGKLGRALATLFEPASPSGRAPARS